MNFLLKILKGGLIGIAAVIPGFSGGTIACIVGCYDEILEAVGGIRKHFKQSILTLLPYVLGIIIFALALLLPITWGLNNFPLITVSLFAGLLIGGLPSFYKNIRGKAEPKNILSAVICGLVVLAIVIPSLFIGSNYGISLVSAPWYMYLLVLLMGFIGATALVVPGISGSMILLILGFYNPIMDTVKAFIASVLSVLNVNISLDYSSPLLPEVIGVDYILPSFGLCLCFGVGILLGFYIVSKIMKFLLNRYPAPTYFGIFGFILASLVGIYAQPTYYEVIDFWTIFFVILFLVSGFFISYLLSVFAEKKSIKSEV